MMDGLKVALATRAPGGSGRDSVWASGTRTEPRRNRRPLDFHDAPRDRAVLVRAMSEARTALREAAIAAATAAFRARSMAEALDDALASLPGAVTGPVDGRTPAGDFWQETAALSPREREVLALVAEGRSNKAIAEALYVSPNTIKTHVASLLHKLDADTRVQLAAKVAAQTFR